MSISSQQRSLRRIRLALLCFSVAANAICAGGVFCFPLISPALVTHLKLTQPQLTTIALAGMMGQYPFAAIVGKILDHYGAWACSLIAAGFLSAGFGLFARELANGPDTVSQPSNSTFHRLVLFFFMGALGTVSSYFSSVFAASKNFPNYIGMAAGTSLALFGLSPTFLSLIASRYFSSPEGEIDVTHFLRFLAILCGCVHLVGGFTMHIIPLATKEVAIIASDPEVPNERTALLPSRNDDEAHQVQVDITSISSDEFQDLKQRAVDVMSDLNFWVLAFVVFVVLGSCEMVLSNVGTIVISLPSRTSINSFLAHNPSTVAMTATQVRVLSVANTLSRLVVGPLADFVSPVPSRNPSRVTVRKHRISRIAFLVLSSATLVCTYTWMVIGVKDQVGIWALSIGAGVAYGCAFTILPSLVSCVWGLANVGRNYGIISYAPFLGTPAFSYLYAFISDASSSSSDDGVGHGPACWTLTFQIGALAAALSCGASVYLWRAWKGWV